MTALITSNEEIKDVMKILKSLEEFGLLIKGVSMLVAANFLENMLAGKEVIQAGKDKIRACQDF